VATPAHPHLTDDIDHEAMRALFNDLDTDGNGSIDYDELVSHHNPNPNPNTHGMRSRGVWHLHVRDFS